MKRLHRRLLTFAAPLVLMTSLCGVMGTMPSTAQANTHYEYSYCDFYFAPGESCPPNGVETWMHIENNRGYAHSEEHEVCVENWYEELKEFSSPKCAIHAGGIAEQPGDGLYGYARVWNGGNVSHIVEGYFIGYKTS